MRAGRLKPTGPRVLSQNGSSAVIAVSNMAEAERFLKEQEAKGIKYQITGPGTPEIYLPGQLHISLSFGGPDGLRAIGYVAQTFFAHCFPALAREKAMQPFIDYTLNGNGADHVWWDSHPRIFRRTRFRSDTALSSASMPPRVSPTRVSRCSPRSILRWCFPISLHRSTRDQC